MRNVFQRVAFRAAFILPFAAFLCMPFPGWAGIITLGSAQNFAVLGHSTVTNTGDTTITGDLGLWTGTSFTPGSETFTLNGALHITDGVAQQAQDDVTTAYNALAAMSHTTDLNGQVLGVDLGTVSAQLTPGVYYFSDSAQLTGVLYLDFSGNPDANFIFQIGSTLTTASASSVVVTSGGPHSGLYWQVGSSATLGTTTTLEGNILAQDSITMTTGAKILCGRALARTAAVTMDTNTISDTCPVGGSPTDFGSSGFSGGTGAETQGVPEPGTLPLLSMGLGAGVLLLRKFRSAR